MASMRGNVVMNGVSGTIGGQITVRQYKDGRTVIGLPPRRAVGKVASPKQKAQQERFRHAVMYAKAAKGKPEYASIAAARGQNPFRVATEDFLHAPEITGITLTGYTGGAGQSIVVTAIDDVKVASVGISIFTDTGTLVEKGAATLSAIDSRLWTYQTTAASPSGSLKVVVDATDLAGNSTEQTAHT